MKCQSLFTRLITKNITNCHLLKFLPNMLSVKHIISNNSVININLPVLHLTRKFTIIAPNLNNKFAVKVNLHLNSLKGKGQIIYYLEGKNWPISFIIISALKQCLHFILDS